MVWIPFAVKAGKDVSHLVVYFTSNFIYSQLIWAGTLYYFSFKKARTVQQLSSHSFMAGEYGPDSTEVEEPRQIHWLIQYIT